METVEDVRELPGTSPRHQRWPWVAGLTVIVVMAAVIGSYVWHINRHTSSSLHSLSAYPTYGVSGPVEVGQTQYLGGNLIAEDAIEHPGRDRRLSVHVSSIKVLVDTNTARADISVSRCVLAGDGSGPMGDESGTSRCSSLTPFTSGNVTLGFKRGDDDIVIAITPRQAGTIRLSGIDVRYDSGSRHGSQHAGAEVATKAR